MSSQKTYPKRLIEVDLPIKKISDHARREKSIRHGHISTLHIWWARRPLAACRAVILAALWPDPADPSCPERFRKEVAARMHAFRDVRGGAPRNWDNPLELRAALLDFIADFANWDLSNDKDYLEVSRALVHIAHESLGGAAGTRPLVIDPFAGGGSIPLEALRVGADAFASDLNPVAVLLNKVVLEYVPKHGPLLAEEVRKWGEWVRRNAENELSEFYPKDKDGSVPIAYLWARTARCEGPGCGAEIPLLRSPWLSKKGTKVALRIVPHAKSKRVEFEIIEGATEKDVGTGTVRRSAATCPICHYTVPADRVRAQFAGRKGGTREARLLAVVVEHPARGHKFRRPSEADYAALSKVNDEVTRHAGEVHLGLSVIPDEPLPYLRSIFNIHLLDVTQWGQLFTARQALALTTFVKHTQAACLELQRTGNADLAEAVASCLALAIGRGADYWSSLTVWAGDFVAHTFGRQALGIIWDFAEANPISNGTGNYGGAIEWIRRYLNWEARGISTIGTARRASATEHPLPDHSAAAFVTDPPYYDAVPYADLSDFFYVWLKRSLRSVHPDLLKEELTPKKLEVVQLAERNKDYSFKTREYFEQLMTRALAEGRRVLTPEGIGVVVFAHKTTVGWETQLQAMIDAGWIITGSWPIDTERPGRLRANNAAALASSIHLVCRPRKNLEGSARSDAVADWRDVLAELPKRIHDWMPRLAEEGVVGADAIFACLGPALEIFSRYGSVEKASGDRVLLKEYLEHVWAAVAKEALAMIFTGADATGFEEDARLTAMWLWTLSTGGSNGDGSNETEDDQPDEEDEDGSAANKGKVGGFVLEYDAARKIAQGLGAHLEQLSSLIEVKGATARLLPVAERTRSLFPKGETVTPSGRGKAKKKSDQLSMGFVADLEQVEEGGGWGDTAAQQMGETVLDRVHQSMILFGAGRSEALKRFLVDDGVGRDDRFWRLAQAFSALYPASTDEKRWVDGVLARKKGLGF